MKTRVASFKATVRVSGGQRPVGYVASKELLPYAGEIVDVKTRVVR